MLTLRSRFGAPFRRLSALFALAMAAVPAAMHAQTAAPTGLVISQVYGGGGNSGATYTNDFIEIFNPTGAPQNLAGYSVQYASSSGSSYQVTPLTNVTLQPGQFYLVQESQGAAGTTSLPTPDVSGTIALSATAGKIALVSSTTALNTSCPTSAANVVDFVGFGGANCFLGTAPAPGPSNTLADLRTSLCVNGHSNSTEFLTGTPNPRNTAIAAAPCAAPGSTISASGSANPATANAGSSTLLTVAVTPATNPPSTGLQVTADLSAVGGYSSQPFYDDGTHGDVTANDSVYSYSLTLGSSVSGSFTLGAHVQDAQARTANTNIALTVQIPPSTVSIRAIQAAKPSPYVGQTVTTSGIVVGVRSAGFYLEAKDADTNPTTPEGIYVYTGSAAKPSFLAVGAEVQVSGKLSTYPTDSLTPSTELGAPLTFALLSSNNPLPTPVKITAAQDSPSGGIYQFTKYEGMRVAIDSVTTTSGTDASLNENTETQTSNGLFFGVVTGVPRPFREPGISVTDTLYGPVPSTIPVFDSNPELLEFNASALGGPTIDLTSNTVLTNVVGVMDFSYGNPEIDIDATIRPSASGGLTPTPLPLRSAAEFTVASFNMERFYNDVADQDNPSSSAVVVTTEAYQRRLNKASLAIRTILNNPDIVGAQEIENLAVLTDLANKVNADTVTAGGTDPQYKPYLFLANDISAINTGFLVKSTTVDTLKVEQAGLNTTFTNAGGQQAILNDRTPLVLHAGIKRAGGSDYPVTVIDVHQRSLINVDDPTSTGQTVRLKREAQAEFLASLIQGYQAAGEHVITVGDFNSFQFSDGFVDAIGVTKGNPVPASQVIQPPTANLVSPNLIDLDTLLPADQQQSYVEDGSAQVLDHVLITQDLLSTFDHLYFAHIDADFPLVDENNANLPLRISDHDPALAYFSVPAVSGSVSLQTTATLSKSGSDYVETVTILNKGTGTAPHVTITSATLGSATGATLPAVLGDIAPNATATVTFTFPASAGPDHTASVERVSGTYTGGTFATSLRAVLP